MRGNTRGFDRLQFENHDLSSNGAVPGVCAAARRKRRLLAEIEHGVYRRFRCADLNLQRALSPKQTYRPVRTCEVR